MEKSSKISLNHEISETQKFLRRQIVREISIKCKGAKWCRGKGHRDAPSARVWTHCTPPPSLSRWAHTPRTQSGLGHRRLDISQVKTVGRHGKGGLRQVVWGQGVDVQLGRTRRCHAAEATHLLVPTQPSGSWDRHSCMVVEGGGHPSLPQPLAFGVWKPAPPPPRLGTCQTTGQRRWGP